jgi:hypothetical protein
MEQPDWIAWYAAGCVVGFLGGVVVSLGWARSVLAKANDKLAAAIEIYDENECGCARRQAAYLSADQK